MRRNLLLVCFIAAAATVQADSAQQALKKGQWVVDVKMEVPNLPAAMPSTKAMVCVNDEASKKPWLISTQQQQGGDCQFGEPKVAGNKITATMSCQGGMVKGQFDIEVKNNGEAYTGVAAMTVGPQTMKTHYDGKWQAATCEEKQ
jgi:hypothetical protein